MNTPSRKKLSTEDIRKGFNELAPAYDRFNDWITLGLHRLWKKKLIAFSSLGPQKGGQVLDLCCGSGDISLLFAKYLGPKGEILALDFSAEMLSVLRRRLDSYQNKKNWGTIKILQQDVTSLSNFSSASFVLAAMGFGLRNLQNRAAALKEVWRVLKPGGRLLVLDVGKVDLALLRPLHAFYFERVVPQIGHLLHGQKHNMYNYLPASARNYPPPKEICKELEQAGFIKTDYKNLLFGSAVIHIAHKA